MNGNFLDFESTTRDDVLKILNRASIFKDKIESNENIPRKFNSTIMASLFYEPSTRTQYSFDIAAHKLGIKTINPNMQRLSHLKGESLLDTIIAFHEMGVNLLTIRHSENFMPHFIANEINIPVINAGDGTNHHPSQALIDLFTILQYKPQIKSLSICIVGDIVHSRVARSLIEILTIMGVQDIRLVSPANLSTNTGTSNIKTYENLNEGLQGCDVIAALRIQTERFTNGEQLNKNHYFNNYGLQADSVKNAKNDAILIHPGPINRGIEIDSSTADGPQSKIKDQIRNGVPVRMALIEHLLHSNT